MFATERTATFRASRGKRSMGVTIAIIDSGVNPWHSHVQGVEGGIAFLPGPDEKVVSGPDFLDEIGHGTALAGIVREKAPDAHIFAVKIFQRILDASASVLLEGLRWSIAQNMKIINLSLGTERDQDRQPLEALCREAEKKGLIVVAAANGPEHQVFPSVFDSVIGVYWNRSCTVEKLIYHPGNPIEFGAYGRPRDLPHLPPEKNLSGSSFAAARVSALVVKLVEDDPDLRIVEVRDLVAKEAQAAQLPEQNSGSADTQSEG
jgi:hypothetical protein